MCTNFQEARKEKVRIRHLWQKQQDTLGSFAFQDTGHRLTVFVLRQRQPLFPYVGWGPKLQQ